MKLEKIVIIGIVVILFIIYIGETKIFEYYYNSPFSPRYKWYNWVNWSKCVKRQEEANVPQEKIYPACCEMETYGWPTSWSGKPKKPDSDCNHQTGFFPKPRRPTMDDP
jgi:hypothetical protein